MDPDANLKEQLEIAKAIADGTYEGSDDAERLAELVLALDEWIKSSGFLPKVWRQTDPNDFDKSTGSVLGGG
jgi:hypothetical protein